MYVLLNVWLDKNKRSSKNKSLSSMYLEIERGHYGVKSNILARNCIASILCEAILTSFKYLTIE